MTKATDNEAIIQAQHPGNCANCEHTSDCSLHNEPAMPAEPCSCGRFAGTPRQHHAVNFPAHYTSDLSGVECIDITRHRNFNVGNAIKYLWRAGLKEPGPKNTSGKDKQIEDLQKAVFYINDEIARLLTYG